PRMKQQARQLDTRVARQGVAQITVFPTGVRLDDQYAQPLVTHDNWRGQTIVVRLRFIIMPWNLQRKRKLTRCLWLPRDPITCSTHCRNPDLLGDLVAVRYAQANGRDIVTRQCAFDDEWNAYRLAGDTEGRGVETHQFNIGQPCATSDRHCK